MFTNFGLCAPANGIFPLGIYEKINIYKRERERGKAIVVKMKLEFQVLFTFKEWIAKWTLQCRFLSLHFTIWNVSKNIARQIILQYEIIPHGLEKGVTATAAAAKKCPEFMSTLGAINNWSVIYTQSKRCGGAPKGCGNAFRKFFFLWEKLFGMWTSNFCTQRRRLVVIEKSFAHHIHFMPYHGYDDGQMLKRPIRNGIQQQEKPWPFQRSLSRS